MNLPRYPTYRDSGVDWLGEVPAHWEVAPIKHNLRLLTDKTDRREYPVALENIESWTGRFIPTETNFQGEGIAFDAGDILFGKLRPYLAKAHLATRSGEAVGDFLVMRPMSSVVGRFAQYQVLNREFISLVDGSTFGSKMPRASWEFVGGLKVVMPPAPEQVQIVDFLDGETTKIDALVAEQQRLIELLKEKRQAVISHAVTKGLNPNAPMKNSGIEWLGEVPGHWKVQRLKQVAARLQGRLIVQPQLYFAEDGVPIVFGYNIKDGVIDESGLSRIDYETDRKHAHAKARAGDLFTVRLGDPGKTVVVPRTLDGCHFASIMWIHQDERFDSEWLMSCMNSTLVQGQIEAVNYGAAQTQFNIRDAADFRLPVPPLQEQREIAAAIRRQLSAIDTLAAEATRAIELLTERRTALISAAVTGQIDVRPSAQRGRS